MTQYRDEAIDWKEAFDLEEALVAEAIHESLSSQRQDPNPQRMTSLLYIFTAMNMNVVHL